MRPVAAAVLAVTMLFATSAHADERRWYGWQGLGADVAAGVMFVAAAEASGDNPSLYVPGLLLYSLGGPLSHFSHGEGGRGVGSLMLRVALPFFTFVAVAGMAETCSEHGCEENLDLGFVTGLAAAASAALFDDLVLGWDDVPRAPSWTPAVAPAPGGVTLGLAGTW